MCSASGRLSVSPRTPLWWFGLSWPGLAPSSVLGVASKVPKSLSKRTCRQAAKSIQSFLLRFRSLGVASEQCVVDCVCKSVAQVLESRLKRRLAMLD